MILEICVENFTSIPEAITKGVNRISLKDNYLLQGTTVSKGVMKKSIEYAHARNISVVVCIRPRRGNFVYSQDELDIMVDDIITARELGADAFDVGCLTPKNELDINAMQKLLAVAGDMSVTFHMAFDEIPEKKLAETIDWLSQHGVSRILTHGGPISEPINIEKIKEIISKAKGKIIVVPGGGVNYSNYQEIAHELGVDEVHGSNIVNISSYEF